MSSERFRASGVIPAYLREVQRSSTGTHLFDLRGDGLITYSVDADTVPEIADDGGKLGLADNERAPGDTGQVTMTAATVAKVVNSVINLEGVVDADAFTVSDSGRTILAISPDNRNIADKSAAVR